jgi:hypothetical protein
LWPAAGQIVALASDAHQPANALHRIVITGAILVRAGLAETSDRTDNQTGVGNLQTLCVQAIAGQIADLEVLDQNVNLAGQMPDQILAGLGGDVDRDRSLVAVCAQVIGGFAGFLITSAPRSARVWVHQGPARTLDRSSTRTPASAIVGALVALFGVSGGLFMVAIVR